MPRAMEFSSVVNIWKRHSFCKWHTRRKIHCRTSSPSDYQKFFQQYCYLYQLLSFSARLKPRSAMFSVVCIKVTHRSETRTQSWCFPAPRTDHCRRGIAQNCLQHSLPTAWARVAAWTCSARRHDKTFCRLWVLTSIPRNLGYQSECSSLVSQPWRT